MKSFLNRRLKLLTFLLLLGIFLSTGSIACSRLQRARQGPPRLKEAGLIDIHAHIGKFKGFDLSTENLITNLKENYVRYALISNIDGADLPGTTANLDEVTINEETARVCAANPQLKPVAWAKPGAKGASADNIEPFLRDKKFLAIKFHPDFNHFSPKSSSVAPYLKLCEKYKVPALFHCGKTANSNPQVLYEVARQYPTVPFVFFHMGFGTDHEDAIAIAKTAKQKNDAIIYLETSQADLVSIQEALEAVGPERIVFGSDATYFGRYHYDFYYKMINALKYSLKPEEFQLIIRNNALKLFRIEEKEEKPAEGKK
ncbi:MAG: amidohydrolase family protein [Blastocatellia bacterium]|nr:amidohydrolase family protein [Blastocatellia bacterium]